jgi:hypothetical protein
MLRQQPDGTRGRRMGPLLIEVLIAGVVAIGLIAVVRAIVTGFSISRRPPREPGKPFGAPPIPPELTFLRLVEILGARLLHNSGISHTSAETRFRTGAAGKTNPLSSRQKSGTKIRFDPTRSILMAASVGPVRGTLTRSAA